MHVKSAAPGTVHLTSLLIQVTSRGRAALLEHGRRSGVRLHETAVPSKLIALLECADESAAAEMANQLLGVAGVLTVSIISHLTESEAALDQQVATAGAHR